MQPLDLNCWDWTYLVGTIKYGRELGRQEVEKQDIESRDKGQEIKDKRKEQRDHETGIRVAGPESNACSKSKLASFFELGECAGDVPCPSSRVPCPLSLVPLSQMLVEKLQRSLPRHRRRLRVVAGPRIAVEAVPCVIPKNLHLRMREVHLLHFLGRDVRVLCRQNATSPGSGRFPGILRDAPAVVAHCRFHRHTRSRQPRQRPAEAIPSNT